MSRTFKGLRLDRIDVVDRPANPQSRIVICKRLDATTEQAIHKTASGGAMTDEEKLAEEKKAKAAAAAKEKAEGETEKRIEKMASEVEVAKREAAEAKAQVLKLQDERERDVFIAKSRDFKAYGPADAIWQDLRDISRSLGTERFAKFEQRLRAVQKQAEEGKLFSEAGSNAEGETVSAWNQIQKAVAETVQKSGGAVTKEQAMTSFLQTDAGKRLYADYTQTMPGMQPGAGREE